MIRRAFNAVDAKVLELHQWAVDTSGRSPAWWTEHAAGLSAVASILSLFLRPTRGVVDIVLTIVLLVFSGAVIVAARADMVTIFASQGTRRFCLALLAPLTIIDAVLIALGYRMSGREWACDIGSLAWLAMNYFTCCEPPKPRPPKRSAAVLQGGAA